MRNILIAALVVLLFTPVSADKHEGDFLYRVTTIRAAPGSLANFLEWFAALKASGYYEKSGQAAPLVMRHSQGDQWDLMFVAPMESWTSYYETSAVEKRSSAANEFAELLSKKTGMIAFSEDHFAFGPAFDIVRNAYEKNSLYHIEMFAAAPGKTDELLRQRRMENAYLAATGQTTNLIFRRSAGSDVDVFTIGFHKDLQAFAAPGGASDDEKERAAVTAGFKDRSDLSFYLRSLMSSHHDTLAVKVD